MKFSLVAFAVLAASLATASAADLYFDGSGANALNSASWGATSGGEKTSSFTSGSTAVFATAGGTGSGSVSSIAVGGIRAEEDFTYSSPSGTFGTGSTVVTVDVLVGKKLSFGSSSFGISTASGTGFIKSGGGEWLLGNGNPGYNGGFTLNAGIMTVDGVNALGSGGSLTINGGMLRSSTGSDKDFSGKFAGGITFGGNFTLGNAANGSTSDMTFSDAISLGSATRTITNDSNGDTLFNGIISGGSGAGLTFDGSGAGKTVLAGDNTYSGDTTINAGTLVLDGAHSGTGLVNVADGAVFGGTGSIAGSLNFEIGARFVFNATHHFTVTGSDVTFEDFGIGDLLGLNAAVDNGSYLLVAGGGSTAFDFVSSNIGSGSAFDLGSGKSAYFDAQTSSLSVVVVPEPSAALLTGLGMLALLRRRRA